MPGMVALIVVLAVVVVLALALALAYNRLVRLRNRAGNAWAQVDVQLRRRYDLIPNLVEAVKGYAAHERQTFEEVVAARNAAQAAGSVAEQAAAESNLGGMLRRLFALAEAYPALRASENFQALQADLRDAEDRIAVARQIYNDSTLSYNNAVQTVPTNLVAALFRFTTRDFFEMGEEARSVPKVQF
jgi:LemA protein